MVYHYFCLPMRKTWKGHTAILLSQLIIGLNVPVGKALLSGWMTPWGLTFIRVTGAAALFWLVSLFVKKENVARSDLPLLALGGVMGLVATQLTYAWGLTYTTPTRFSLIVALSPIVVMLLSALILHEPFTRWKALGVTLGIMGAWILLAPTENWKRGGTDSLGALFAFGNTLALGLYLILIRKVAAKYSPLTLMKWMCLFAALTLSPIGLKCLAHEPLFVSTGRTWWTGLALLSFSVVLATFLNHFLKPIALRDLRPTTVSLYSNLQPLIASTVALAVGQDSWSWEQPLSAALVIGGVLVVTWEKKRSR